MAAQLALEFPSTYRIAEEWERLLELVRRYSSEMGEKEASDLCDARRSTYNNSLAERHDHEVKARWLVAHVLAAKARGDRAIPALFADLVDCDLLPRKVLTNAERDHLIVEQLRSEAPGFYEAVAMRAGVK